MDTINTNSGIKPHESNGTGRHYPLAIESWGSDRYMVVSRGHHDCEAFKAAALAECCTAAEFLYKGSYPVQHLWYKATPRDGYVAWYSPVPQGTRGAFPATVWAE